MVEGLGCGKGTTEGADGRGILLSAGFGGFGCRGLGEGKEVH